MKDSLLQVDSVHAAYSKKEILTGLSLEVNQGELVSVIGPNGAGKSTLLKTIVGVVRPVSGRIIFAGQDITGLPAYQRVRLGIGYLKQGGAIFPSLTVLDNLMLARQNGRYEQTGGEVFALFPELREIQHRRAGSLSGGQQQMLSLAMATLRRPRLLLLDEPSAGLAPNLVDRLMERIRELHVALGIAILMVEQNIRRALSISDRACVIREGAISAVFDDAGRLSDDESLKAVLQV